MRQGRFEAGHALYAYECTAGVRPDSGTLATRDDPGFSVGTVQELLEKYPPQLSVN